jgi:hypothetical protein
MTLLSEFWNYLWTGETPMKKKHNQKDIPQAEPSPVLTAIPYKTFSPSYPWKDQGSDLLKDADCFARWTQVFRPSIEPDASQMPAINQRLDNANRGYGFEIIPPKSYPAVVVYVRIRRMGLTECEFYWDYVYPSDFDTKAVRVAERSK